MKAFQVAEELTEYFLDFQKLDSDLSRQTPDSLGIQDRIQVLEDRKFK